MSLGRNQEEVVALLSRLSDPDAVKAVRMDMSASYRPAVQLCLPHAQLVVDHFHVIQQVMKGFKKVLQRWAHKKECKSLLEGKNNRTTALMRQAYGYRNRQHLRLRILLGEVV